MCFSRPHVLIAGLIVVAALLALGASLALGVTLQPGWPQPAGGHVVGGPALGDLDGDGELEVVVGSYDMKVYAWDGSGTPVAGWPQTTGGDVEGSPTLGDLDGDGGLEVVVGSWDGKVYAWHGSGTTLSGWPQTTGDVVWSNPALGDLDGDGGVEVVVGSNDWKVYAWHANGTPVAGWPQTTGGYVASSPALGDLDGDGDPEVVVGSDDSSVYAWHGNGTLVAGWPQTTTSPYWVRSSPALGDLDGDGDLEVVVGSHDDNVYAWHGNGTPVTGWPQLTGNTVFGSPALGDLDGDGDLEIVVGAYDSNIYAWHGDGTPVAGWPQITTDLYWVRSSPALGDLDGNGDLEVVVGSDDWKVYAWYGNGTPVPGWPQVTGNHVAGSPALGDLDGDGDVEVVVGSRDDSVYAWSCDVPTTNLAPWPMFHHGARRTGQYGEFRGRVLWDLTHGVDSGYEPADQYSELAAVLATHGYSITTTSSGIAGEDLSQYDALVVCLGSAWNSAYTPTEVAVIQSFVSNGGGLVILGDNTYCPNGNINPVASVFGITLGVGELSTSDIEQYAIHPVNAGITALSFVYGGALDVVSPATPVWWATALEPAAAVASYGKGRAVAAGDTSVWQDGYLSLVGNRRFAVNVFDWVTPPLVKHFTINQGAEYTSDPSVVARAWVSRCSEARWKMASADPWSPWLQIESLDPVDVLCSLVAGPDGKRAVYMQARNRRGDITPTYCDTILLDTAAPPVVKSFRVNDAAQFTASRTVTLKLTFDCAHRVRFKHTYAGTWSEWREVANSTSGQYTWTLMAGADGPRHVYAQAGGHLGNLSAVVCRTIVLDTTTAPAVKSFFINHRAATTDTTHVMLTLFVDCAVEARSKNKYDDQWGEWQPLSQCNYGGFAWELEAGADGPRSVYVQARDHHGNLSTVRCDTIELNTGGG